MPASSMRYATHNPAAAGWRDNGQQMSTFASARSNEAHNV
eukprot:CAMPEP_0197863994 /NCGR_PEP_ID=MMETSP1438-20131217/41850_1 /TAXON_ID=1461541 /ORGANISM="Pterosperma sp., Strain CCMP1384" /LENGTH=39 /DNA_ID= /DNA_START= /DNA_END= /DNA_ORIENTATION=